MNKYYLISYFVVGFHFAYSQKISVELPLKAQAQINQEFIANLNIEGIQKYKIKVEGNPPTSIVQNNKFRWIPKSTDAKNYLVKFYLQDSVGKTLSETTMDLSVDSSSLLPSIQFDRFLPDTLRVVENESFSLSASIKSGRESDAKSLMTYFLFNENPDLRSFDSCTINRIGNQLLFRWTPSNREAVKSYAKLRITIVDTDNSVFSQVLNFKIKNVNRAPVFKFEIPDTVFITGSGHLVLDFSANDPDNDNLKYDYTPKSPLYYWQDHKIIFRQDDEVSDHDKEYPIHLSVSATDGEHTIKRTVAILKDKQYHQLTIGDFTRKEFFEGDSALTFLNLTNDGDLKNYDVKFNDLALPPGISSLTSHLTFEKGPSYLKVRSKGVLPYYLVDQDYTYDIAVTLTNKNGNTKPFFKILELTVNDRPDPSNIGQQKDSLFHSLSVFLKTESIYKSNLEKLHSSINRPWWKKVAVITGTLSGVLSLVQSQDPQKSISIISAGISLVSITVTNLPSLTEKPLNELNDKISASKGRIERIQEKESDFKANWTYDIDRANFYKMKADLIERINKGHEKRREEVCSLLKNKTLKKRIERLLKAKSSTPELKNIFSCSQ